MSFLKLAVLGEGEKKERKKKVAAALVGWFFFFPFLVCHILQEVAESPVLLFCQQHYSFRGTNRYLLNINPLCSTFLNELLQKQ